MNEATAQRHALAAQVAAHYADSPKVAAVALAGSVARGWADHHSDIELDVYWAEPPTDADRLGMIARAGGQIDIFWAEPPSPDDHQRIFDRTGVKISQLWPWEPDEWSEHYYVRDISIGISGFVVPTIERYMQDVLVQHTTEDEPQIRLAALQAAVPLAGATLLRRWQTRIAEYPRGLAVALVREQLRIDEVWWNVDMWVERNAHLPLIDALYGMQLKILRVLLALNRIYLIDPRFKWADRLIDQMTVHPENVGHRLHEVFRLEPARAVAATSELFLETLGLVEERMPEIDVAFVRRCYQHRRPVHSRL